MPSRAGRRQHHHVMKDRIGRLPEEKTDRADNDVQRKLDVRKPMLPITSVRKLGKKDMLHNDALPVITVDAQTFKVFADGKLLTVEPATRVPLGRKYMLR
jgi:urease subunit alpha